MYKLISLSLLFLIPFLTVGQSALDGFFENGDVNGLKQYLKNQARQNTKSDNDTLDLVEEIYKAVLYDAKSPFYLDFKQLGNNTVFIHQNKLWLNICELRFLYEDKFFKKHDLSLFAIDVDMVKEFESWDLPERVSFKLLKKQSYEFYRKILENQLAIIRDSGKQSLAIDNFVPSVKPVGAIEMISVPNETWEEIFLFANGMAYYPAYHFSRPYTQLKSEKKVKYDFLAKGIANFTFHQQGEKNAPQLPMEIFMDSKEDFAIIYLSHGSINHHLFIRKLNGKWVVLENVFGYRP